MKLSIRSACALPVLACLLAAPAFAGPPEPSPATAPPLPLVEVDTWVEDDGGAERIEIADRLRTLTQEIASSVCRLHNGVDPEHAAHLLRDSIGEFDAGVDHLINGDPNNHMSEGEHLAHVLRDLHAVEESWTPIRVAAMTLLDQPHDAGSIAVIYSDTETLLTMTDQLESEIVGEYANPVQLLYSDALLLDIAGKQAMYAERIAYEVCRVTSGDRTEERIDELVHVTEYFENALKALHDGNDSFGITPPPTDEIRIALEVAVADWSVIRALIDRAVAGEDLSMEERVHLSASMDAKMHKMDVITHLYALHSKRVM